MIGLLRAAIVGVPATVWLSLQILWSVRFRTSGMAWYCEHNPRRWARLLLWATGTRVELENLEVLRPGEPGVLVSNHASWFDVLALVAFLPGPYRFVAKRELLKVPFFGPAMGACGHISIDRSDRMSAMEALDLAGRKIREDAATVIFFPEGTRSDTGELHSFKKGAFVLAIQTGVQVVPCAVIGGRDVMPKGSWRIRTGRTIRVRLGDRLPVDGLGTDDRNALTERARSAVRGLLEGRAHGDPHQL